ncbi:hypothetical protein I312_103494 [Cryptococcus bacillisporus CA1280]|uniref:uncharacterized protein n=1 Tax=Cryptococcus bacillisporus CA1280 TaxID=1296109 RepID=UPI00336840E9
MLTDFVVFLSAPVGALRERWLIIARTLGSLPEAHRSLQERRTLIKDVLSNRPIGFYVHRGCWGRREDWTVVRHFLQLRSTFEKARRFLD